MLKFILLYIIFLTTPSYAADKNWLVTFDNAEPPGNSLVDGTIWVKSGDANSAINKANSDLKKHFGKDQYNATAAEKQDSEINEYWMNQFIFLHHNNGVIVIDCIKGETCPKDPNPKANYVGKK